MTDIYRLLDKHQPFFAVHYSKRAKAIFIKTFLHRRTSNFYRYLRVGYDCYIPPSGFDCYIPIIKPRVLLWIPSHIHLLSKSHD